MNQIHKSNNTFRYLPSMILVKANPNVKAPDFKSIKEIRGNLPQSNSKVERNLFFIAILYIIAVLGYYLI